MKSSSNNPANTDYSDFEDLTLFADESFDTDEVDLFEFTGEEDSPLTRLKSIILSLDWEINDDILQELAEEVQQLQDEMGSDKIAMLYLQGLEKIGRYLRSEGAYSHPNSIKLLLTFFYDFEKIISTEDLTEEAITLILKRDVRKFKILQYQISRHLDHGRSQEEIEEIRSVEQAVAEGQPISKTDRLKLLKAIILGLDWEVTDDGLAQFQEEVAHYAEEMADNDQAMVLIKGLLALGGYITDEKSKAHPDAFSMLHSFYTGLEELVTKADVLDKEARNEIVVDRVGRLNTLKAVIAAGKMSGSPGQMVEDVVDEIVEPVQEEPIAALAEEEPPAAAAVPEFSLDEEEDLGLESQLDAFLDLDEEAVSVTAGADLPEEELDPSAITPVSDQVADAHIEEQLSSRRSLKPALSDADVEADGAASRWDEGLEDADAQHDLEGQLSALFDANEEEEEAPAPPPPQVDEPTAALSGAEDDSPAAMAMDDEDILPSTAETSSIDEIDGQLDMLFGEAEEPGAVAEMDVAEEQEDAIIPALVDSEEDSGFSEERAVAEMQEGPSDEIEEKLDSFFGAAEEEPQIVAVAEEEAEEDDELEGSLDAFFGEEEVAPAEGELSPALADFSDVTENPADETIIAEVEQEDVELEQKLEDFFGASEEEPVAAIEDSGSEDHLEDLLSVAEEEVELEESPVAEATTAETSDLPETEDVTAESGEGLDLEAAEAALFNEEELAQTDLDSIEVSGSLDELEEMEDLALSDDLDSIFEDEESVETAEEPLDELATDEETLLDSSLESLLEDDVITAEEEEVTTETEFAEETPELPSVEAELEDDLEALDDETELEENLDQLFGDEAVVEEEEEEVVEEVAMEEEAVAPPPIASDLERLAGLLSGLSAAVDRSQTQECAQLLTTMREEGELAPGQKSFSHLLSSMLNLLPLQGDGQDDETGPLFAHLMDKMEGGRVEELPEALDRFTSWQVNLINRWAEGVTAGANEVDRYQELAAEVKRVMNELQQSLQQEIALLK